MHLLKIMLKATGKQVFPQSGVISPLFSNVYLTEVDQMLEKAIETTRNGKHTYVQYARCADDDLVILIDSHPRHDWLVKAVNKRLREELAKLRAGINEENSRLALESEALSTERRATDRSMLRVMAPVLDSTERVS